MFFVKEYVERFENEFGPSNIKISGMKVKKWLRSNEDIDSYLREILKNEPRYGSFGNVVWAFRNDFNIDEYRCKTCGKQLKMIHATQLKQFCSSKCSSVDIDLVNKRNITISNDPEYYAKRQEKIRRTNLERYGVDIPVKSDVIKNKIKTTISKDPNFWEKRNEKTKKTCIERYGVENPYNLNDVKERSRISHLMKSYKSFEKFKDFAIPLFSFDEYSMNYRNELKWKCCKCGNSFSQTLGECSSNMFYNMPRCFDCYPKTMSVFQKDVFDICKKYFKNVIVNDRKILNGLELDLVIPDINLALECNGIYWHSQRLWNSKNEDFSNYHLSKTKLCNSNGYRLIHIWEDEWFKNRDDIEKRLIDVFEGHENLIFNDDTIKLDRSLFNNIEIPGYCLIEEIEPDIVKRMNEYVENCGYLLFKKSQS